jgi:hypothetical protein
VELAVRAEPGSLPFAAGTFAGVIDTSRPEEPGDHGRRLAELLRVCRPGGTVATIACGGAAGGGRIRAWPAVRSRLVGDGHAIVRAVPFDLLGARSPWWERLGGREDAVLAELESHLRFRAVRRAVRFLERRLVAALRAEEAASVAVVVRRGPPAAGGDAPAAGVRDVLASRSFARGVLRLLRDDAVVRFAAFLDTALLSPAGVPFHLARWVAERAADPELAREAWEGLLPRRIWWSTRRDTQRLLAAAGHRLAHRAIAALATLPGARADGVSIPETLEYDLVALFNRELGRCTEETPS